MSTRPVFFGSTIKLVSKREMQALVPDRTALAEQGEYASGDYTIQDRVSLKQRGFTDDAADCTLGGVQNGKKLTLFHLAPIMTQKAQSNTRTQLLTDIEALKSNGPVKGFLGGGWDFIYNYTNCADWSSQGVFHLLKQVFAEGGVRDVSMLWGRKNAGTLGKMDAYYDVNKDTWFVNADHGRGLDILTWEDLQEQIRHIHLAPGDTLKTIDRVVRPEDLPN